MRNKSYIKVVLFFLVLGGLCCKQPYIPPNIKGNHNYLVVDGNIVAGADSTIINLSRTQNVSDSIYNFFSVPEVGAMVSVVGANGETFALIEQFPGRYVIDSLNLNTNELYRLQIVTANGNRYLSDSVLVKITPPIDSVSWKMQQDGVHTYVTTHDPQQATRYYRWQYVETWQYHSSFLSEYQYLNGQVVPIDTSQYAFNCWRSNQSSDLLLGTSAKLTADEIYEQPLTFIPFTSEELSLEYSILVKQYALSAQGYAFWQLLQQNTEQLGSLFAAQPSQLTGNVHNVTDPNEPVIGYVDISSLQEQRIFINKPIVWGYIPSQTCPLKLVSPDSFAFYFGIGYVPVQPQTPPGAGYYSSYSFCVICTLAGGTNEKPPFWQ